MTNFKKLFIILIIVTLGPTFKIFGQDQPVSSSWLYNPMYYNAGYIGREGMTELNMFYRQQWQKIEGAPRVLYGNIQIPINKQISLGGECLFEEAGLLRSTSMRGGASYHLQMSKNQWLNFGIMLGAGKENVIASSTGNVNDPVFRPGIEDTWFMSATAGVMYFNRFFEVGISAPQLIERDYAYEGSRDNISFGGINYFTSQAAIVLNLDKKSKFKNKTGVLYRHRPEVLGDGWEVFTNFMFYDIVSVGAGYRNNFGPILNVAIQLKKRARFSYQYDFPTNNIDGFNNGSQEFNIAIGLSDQNYYYIEPTVPQVPAVVPQEENQALEFEEDPIDELIEDVSDVAVAIDPSETVEDTMAVEQQEVEFVDVPADEDSPANLYKMNKGHYIVVGSFEVEKNASDYTQKLNNEGIKTVMGYRPEAGLYYTYVFYTESNIEEALKKVYQIRKINRDDFRKAWILTIR
ncbi:PorP/SprF family type IX secretion system membrane protein [Marinigracilibium pacificum]|uniref:PorP/SprF family type IX secretion system membrane protein n=1 Tax=Marinigracilibium pacificum TaxID=2729599 RepID=A0A848IVD7_9BACT|nr:PorP/SprF family type IX secretion system membrane protein [Marinigracilibium pacificum]NMM47245.1 PorP/SprF family type IX secretion system membrane protein [Marinigracilibium pacificum]